MGVAALIVGIASVMLSQGLSGTGRGWYGSILGLLAIVLGLFGKKNPEQKKLANAGWILGVIAALWGIFLTMAFYNMF